MTSAPPAERRSAAAFSSDMRTTATGGDAVPCSAWVRTISIPPARSSRSINVCLIEPGAVGAIMYWLLRALGRLRLSLRVSLRVSLREAERVSSAVAVMACLSTR